MMTEPRPRTAPWSETTTSSPNSWRPADGAETAVTVPLIVVLCPLTRFTNADGALSVPSAGE